MVVQVSRIDDEINLGRRAKHAWDEFVEPFHKAKSEELFEAFKRAKSTDVESLSLIKMQLNCLDMLLDNFKFYIETGVLAEIELENGKSKSDLNNGW